MDMDLFVLDTDYKQIAIIDDYKSLLWIDRFWKAGEFEIYSPVSDNIIQFATRGRYLSWVGSEHIMIIEAINIITDNEEGDLVMLTGRSIESILDRRIIWQQTNLSGNLQNGIKKLLTNEIINPSLAKRRISNFIFEESTDPAITSLTHEAQYTGDNLYEVIQKICEDNHIGFKLTLNLANQFVFKLYAGVDRTYDQFNNPYVIFSNKFDNILNSKYIENEAEWKNVTLVAGEGEGTARKTLEVGNTASSGLDRREYYTDARDLQTETYDDNNNQVILTPAEYNAKLKTRGEEHLLEVKFIEEFEGEVDHECQFIFNEDYFMGDLVQVENEYGMQGVSRLLELCISNDEDGYKLAPTFSDFSMN